MSRSNENSAFESESVRFARSNLPTYAPRSNAGSIVGSLAIGVVSVVVSFTEIDTVALFDRAPSSSATEYVNESLVAFEPSCV